MKATPVSSLKPDALDSLLSGIPFYKDLMFNDPEQMKVLLKHSQLYEPDPGEVVIEKGGMDKTFYFLLSGQLAVFPDGKKKKEAQIYLSSGQILGALALLCNAPRTATLVADPKSGRVQLFGADFTPFGALTDFSKITLSTKLVLWRLVMNNTKWKLGVFKMQNPDHPVAQALQKVEVFSGEKNSVEELQSLDRQIHQLTDLMQQWNDTMG
ncbi:MAG: cyclic nucleotide-binding domain-containing protein [Gammaproteobacteria bacterium]